MKRQGTKNVTSDEARNPAIGDLRRSLRRLRILTASLFALTIVLNLTPAAAVIKEKITGEDVVDGSLTGADIQNRSLTGIDVAGSGIDGFNVALDTLVGGHVEDDSLTTLDIQDGTLTGTDVQDNSLTGGDVQDNSLTGAEVQNGSLTSADVQDGSLTSADVANSSLNGSDVLDNSLTGSEIDESTLINNDAHEFSDIFGSCDPHSLTYIHCGTLEFTLGHSMPVIAFWNYAFGSDIVGDRARGFCQTKVDDEILRHIGNGTYEELPSTDFAKYGATPIVDVFGLGAGTHTISLWCLEEDPDDTDFVVFDLQMAVVELGLD